MDAPSAPRPHRVLIQPSYGNPISRRNWASTLAAPVPLDRVADAVTPAALDALRRAHPDGAARFSGLAATHARTYAQLAPGDVVVMTGQKAVRGIGEIGVLFDAAGFSGALWENQRGGCDFPLGYSLRAFRETEVPYEVIWALPGFSAGDMFMGARLLDAGKAAQLLGALPPAA